MGENHTTASESGITSIGVLDTHTGMSELRAGAETAVRQCLDLVADESCVIVTDDKREPIGEALYEVAREITDDVSLLRFPPGDQHGAEPPAPVAAAMQGADTFLAPTTKSLSHTRARSDATDAGARGATLPGITDEVFITAVHDQLLRRGEYPCSANVPNIDQQFGPPNLERLYLSRSVDRLELLVER